MDAAVREREGIVVQAIEGRVGHVDGDGEEILYGRIHTVDDGGQYAGGSGRTSGHWARGKRAVAENDVDFVDGNAGLVGDDLCNDRVGAGANVLSSGANACRAVWKQGDGALRGTAPGTPGGAGNTPAEDEFAVAHGADLRGALGPAELLGA